MSRFYKCGNCNFVLDVVGGVSLDEALGDDEAALRPDATRESIDHMDLMMWHCPMCKEGRDTFAEYPEGGDEREAA